MIISFSVSVAGEGTLGPHAAAGSEEATKTGAVSVAVTEAVRVVRASGLPNSTSSMFTEIEGEWDEVMGVLKDVVDAVSPYGARVSLVMKADIRPGFENQMAEKVQRIETRLNNGQS